MVTTEDKVTGRRTITFIPGEKLIDAADSLTKNAIGAGAFTTAFITQLINIAIFVSGDFLPWGLLVLLVLGVGSYYFWKKLTKAENKLQDVTNNAIHGARVSAIRDFKETLNRP